MNAEYLVTELSKNIAPKLAKDIISDFIAIRDDCKTGTLGRISVGKFVETVVQILQFLENGSYEEKPIVDSYLRNLELEQPLLTITSESFVLGLQELSML